MGFFSRLFTIGKAEANAALDKFEDPIRITEQGIRDLKKDLGASLQSLAEVKSMAIRMERDIESQRQIASDYEKKAMLLLQKAKKGELDSNEADRLAVSSLEKKETAANKVVSLTAEKEKHTNMIAKLETNCNNLKSKISTYENELTTLKARHKTALATKKLNQQMAKIDSSGTIAMMEKMRDKVSENEALAEAYGDVAQIDKSVDSEIDSALKSGSNITANESLAKLKAKMGA